MYFLVPDSNDINDIIWDLIHSYKPGVLKDAVMHYKNVGPPRPDMPKREIPELNVKVGYFCIFSLLCLARRKGRTFQNNEHHLHRLS